MASKKKTAKKATAPKTLAINVDANVNETDPIVSAGASGLSISLASGPVDVQSAQITITYIRQSGAAAMINPILVTDVAPDGTVTGQLDALLGILANMGNPAAGSTRTKKLARVLMKFVIDNGLDPRLTLK